MAEPARRQSRRGLFLAEGRRLGEDLGVALDLKPLPLQIVGDGAAEARISDPVGRIGEGRQVAAGELVLALGAGLDALEAVSERPFDRLVVAELEVRNGCSSIAPQYRP